MFLAITVDWCIVLFTVIVFILFYGFIAIFAAGIGKRVEQLFEAYESFTKRSREMLSAFHIIKSNNLEERVAKEMDRDIKRVQASGKSMNMYAAKINVYLQVAASVVSFAFMSVIVYRVAMGKLSVAQVMFMLTTFVFVFTPGMQVFQTYPLLKEGKTALKQI